jgi:capping protein beta
MGRMIEDMENRMRDSLQDVYFGKTKSTVNKLYRANGAEMEANKQALARGLQDEMARRAGGR